MRDIAQTSAGTEYNSLSFQQLSLCIGRIKHLWCSQTFNPSRKALSYSKVGTTVSLESPPIGRYLDLHENNLMYCLSFKKEKKITKKGKKNKDRKKRNPMMTEEGSVTVGNSDGQKKKKK